MWQTSRGDRRLRGPEAALVAAAVDTMIDRLHQAIDEQGEEIRPRHFFSGIALFDSLTIPQQISLLHAVARDLLTESPPPPEPSAAEEAAIAAIFAWIFEQIASELEWLEDPDSADPGVDVPSFVGWRSDVAAAAEAVFQDELDDELAAGSLPAEPDPNWDPEEDGWHFEVPEPLATEIDVWGDCLEHLADAILWDRDFEMAEDFLDADPIESRHRRHLLGINDDYFTRIAPDPRPAELRALISQTRALVRSKPR